MKLFRPLYERALKWAAHPKAEIYLGLLSFVEDEAAVASGDERPRESDRPTPPPLPRGHAPTRCTRDAVADAGGM